MSDEFGLDIMNLELHECLIVAKGSRLSGFIVLFTCGHTLVEGH